MTREETLQQLKELIPTLTEPLRTSGSATIGHFAWTLTDTCLTLADLTTNLVLDSFPLAPNTDLTNKGLQDWLKNQRNRMRLHLTTVCAQAGLETFVPTDRPPTLPVTLTNLSCPLSRISLLIQDPQATGHDLLTFMLHLTMFYASEREGSQIHLVSPMPTRELLGQCLYDLYPDWGIAQPLKHITCSPCPIELSSQWLQGCFYLTETGEGTIIISDLSDAGRSYNSQAVPVLYQHPSLPINRDLLRTVMDIGPIRLILVYRGQHLIPDWMSSMASTIIQVTSGIAAIKIKPKPPVTLRLMPVQP